LVLVDFGVWGGCHTLKSARRNGSCQRERVAT
jgi:hypothetical protein